MPDTKHFISPFVSGLNTELSSVQDLPQHTADELNCTVYPEGIRGRRYGMSIEQDGEEFTVEGTPSSFQGYLWKNVAKTSIDFIVYQVDTKLYFYNAENKPFSAAKNTSYLDITQYITDSQNFYLYPVKFVSGAGFLICVSKYLQPLKITYDFSTATFNAEIIYLKYRDFEGLDDGLKIDDTPATLTDEHQYNLRNQGWTLTNINAFHADRNVYPSNNLQWFIGKDNSGNYNTTELLKHYFGNTPAPRGHFILNYFEKNRSEVSGIWGDAVKKATWAYSNNWIRNRAYHATPIPSLSVTIPGTSGQISYVSVQFQRLYRKVGKRVWGPWTGLVTLYVDGWDGLNWEQVYSIYHYYYGTSKDGDNSAEVYLIDLSGVSMQNHEYYRVRAVFPDIEPSAREDEAKYPAGITCNISMSMKGDSDILTPSDQIMLNKVTDVAYMSGKFFYLVGDTVLFSQTAKEDDSGYDQCYQDADPTSEEISDIVPTDGGYEKFQTMGDGLALKTFNRGVLVFGRDVVWGLISPLNGRFTATEYDTVELSRAGLVGPQSVVSVANFVYYWSPLGIFRIGVNQQTGSTMVAENITQMTIQSFYNNIPDYAKEQCRAAFDYANNRIYWFYPLDGADLSNLNGCLIYDLNYNAFYPQQISEGNKIVAVFDTVKSYEINPTIFLRAGGDKVIATENGEKHFVIATEEDEKYNRFVAIGHCMYNPKTNGISFCDYNSREFIDWDKSPYDSYMVSRPIMIEGMSAYGTEYSGTYNNKQVPILQTLFKRTEEEELRTKGEYIAPSGAYIRMRWGWSLNDNSNRWDMIQNAYRPQKDFRNDEYVESRIHIRGRGKAYQIEVRNDDNKDFRLAGINSLVRTNR